MSEFDLIPDDYKYWLWQRCCMKRTAIVMLVFLILVVILSTYFRVSVSRQNTMIIDLQRQLAISTIQQDQMSSLSEDEQLLRTHWKLLKGLRGGARVESILEIIDESLSGDDVWFLSWRLQRQVQKVTGNGTAQGGNYLIDYTNHLAGDQSESLSINTQVLISGQARDHSAFSAFVQRLTSSSRILDVNIARTSLSSVNKVNIIEFSIQLLINNNPVLNSE